MGGAGIIIGALPTPVVPLLHHNETNDLTMMFRMCKTCLLMLMTAFSADAFSTTSFHSAQSFNQRGIETVACLSATSVKDDNINVPISRRKAIAEQTAFIFTAFASVYSGYLPEATALDMDAFINSELSKDTKECNPKTDPKCRPSMSDDEALCKYGQSGQARGEACQRFRASGGALPASGTKEKSLGGAYAM